jgi:hypothetical protein
MNYLISLALIIISTCASAFNDDPTALFDASNVHSETVKVTWKRVKAENLLETCQKVYKLYRLPQITYAIRGCSIWVGNECTIITPDATSMHTLGHETRHCFQQAWHD